MDSSTIRGRYSLSTTNLTSPIAESTCLNNLSTRSKFNWGEGTISPRSRHNSVDNNNSMSRNVNGIPSKVSMAPSPRIDPRTYVDIHSNGLASRIVKYHDNSARLNRSLSMTNLYNKPGQFPVVHLKKNEQQYKAKKTKNLSMTRIAAPEKSVFHGNTLSSILRSGSIVGLQKSDEEISRENRPILHPPPTENEMAPTRSVLEVLKEISRKRINSDEMDGTELTKKHCKESEQDAISSISQRTQSKRQREITNSSASNSQISPEQQVIKKRMCNYNNDIMSSLSSSMTSVNKKKMLQIPSQKRTASDLGPLNASNTSSSDFESSRSEKQRCVGNSVLNHLATTSKYTPITPIPSTPHQNANELDGGNRSGIVCRRASEPVLRNTKPKLTLFNTNYDEEPTIVNNDTTETKEDGDLCGIQFVKPKKSSSISSGGSLLMEKTKKSKLALMLSGLKGELDEEDEFVPKQDPPKSASVTSALNILTSTTSLSKTTSMTVATPKVVDKPIVEVSGAKSTENSSELKLNSITVTSTASTASSGLQINTAPVSTNAIQMSLPAITTSSLSLISSFTIAKPVSGGLSFGSSIQNTTSTTTPALTLSSTAASQTPALTSTSPASFSVPSTVSVTDTKAFTFGLATTQASTPSAPSFSFGVPTTLSKPVSMTKELALASTVQTPTSKATELASPLTAQSSISEKPSFSFGSLAGGNTNTNALTTAAASSVATIGSTQNFGSQKNTWGPSGVSSPVSTKIIGIGSFGGGGSFSLPQSSPALPPTTSTGGFSFGSSSSNTDPKPMFGSMTPATVTSTNTNTTFSFSATKAPANSTSSTNAFTFGTSAVPAIAAPSNAALTFGTTAAAPAINTTPQNMFANTTTTKTSNTFSFGSSGSNATPQKAAFAFSSSDNRIPAASSTSSSVGGFSFNNPSGNSLPAADASKNIFGSIAATPAETKPAFNFGSSGPINKTTDKPQMFGASTNIFGAPATSSAPQQSSAFTFGSSTKETPNQQQASSNTNHFGSASISNVTSGLGITAGSNSVFGAPSAVVAPLQQSSTFTFGASSSNTKQETNKPGGGFVFGSSSSIGSNASKPAVDMNKTFVFGDSNTSIKPASSAPSIFGGSNVTNGGSTGITGSTENKTFSFGAASGGNNNTFAAGHQQVNPAFNFGAVAPAATAAPPPSNGNLFAPQGQAPPERVIKKAMRRLHKT